MKHKIILERLDIKTSENIAHVNLRLRMIKTLQQWNELGLKYLGA